MNVKNLEPYMRIPLFCVHYLEANKTRENKQVLYVRPRISRPIRYLTVINIGNRPFYNGDGFKTNGRQ